MNLFSKDELYSFSDIQLYVLASYLQMNVEGDTREEMINKIFNKVSSAKTVYELYEEAPSRSIQVQRIYDSQKENNQ